MIDEKEYIRLKEDYERLKTAVNELAILNEIATTISSTIELDKIVEIIVKKCIRHFNVEQGNISLIKESEMVKPLQTMVREYDSVTGQIPFRLDQQLIGWMLTKKEPLIINDLANDQRFSSLASETSYNSLIAVAMMYKSKLVGVLSLYNKRNKEEFDKNDLRLLTIIATESSQVIENARLLEEEKDLMSVKEELRISGQIQKRLLPEKLPEIPGYQIAATNIPAKEVGGDYYDVIYLSDTKYAFCFGDVSGKGIPAGLLMSNLQATMRSLLLSQDDPALIVKKANTLLHASTTSEKYITFILAILDSTENTFTYCNAGHDKPIHIKDSKCEQLLPGGIPLGFLSDFNYSSSSTTLLTKDIIIIYTDGVTEAMNSKEEEFGLENFKNIICENRVSTAPELLNKVLNAINKHTKGTPQMDDITLVILKKE
jgi:sigma-B regulation protein RsbU (phosphoserine phosphatase)